MHVGEGGDGGEEVIFFFFCRKYTGVLHIYKKKLSTTNTESSKRYLSQPK